MTTTNPTTEVQPTTPAPFEARTNPLENERVRDIALSDIEVDWAWNARSEYEEKETTNPDGKIGLAGLMASIAEKGQDTPVDIRRNRRPGGKPYKLVTGFRRYKAISALSKEHPNGLNGKHFNTIRAIVHDLTDLEARALNVRENTAREDLSGPDLAWAVYQMKDEAKSNGVELSNAAIARDIGRNQGYVNDLLKIMMNVRDNITEKWRNERVNVLSVDDMLKVAKKPAIEQDEAYETAKQKKSRKKTGEEGENLPTAGPEAWVTTAAKKAEDIGTRLGVLEREGYIECKMKSPAAFRQAISLLVDLKKSENETQPAHWNAIVEAAHKGYQAGLVKPAVSDAPADTKETTAMGANGAKQAQNAPKGNDKAKGETKPTTKK